MALWRDHLDSICGIDRQPGGEQTDGEETTQMRWSQQGAHLLLQVRTRVLNDELRDVFRQWYPSFSQGDENQRLAA